MSSAANTQCAHCAAALQVPESLGGKVVRCPACTKTFTVRFHADQPVYETNPPPIRQAPHQSRDGDDNDDDYDLQRRHQRPLSELPHAQARANPWRVIVDYLLFRRMVATVLIPVCFWLWVFVIVITWMIFIVHDVRISPTASDAVKSMLYDSVVCAGALIFDRVVAEALIVFFRINDTLTAIKNQKER